MVVSIFMILILIKKYYIDDVDINFVKGYGYDLIGNPDNPYGTSAHHEYFFIHDDFFDRILETNQNSDIVLKVIKKDVYFPSINDNVTYSSSKLKNRYEIVSTCNQLQRKLQKKVHDYSHKLIENFKTIVLNPPPKLTDKKSVVLQLLLGLFLKTKVFKITQREL